MKITVQIEKNMEGVLMKPFKDGDEIIGIITDYDKVTGIAGIEIYSDSESFVKRIISKGFKRNVT